MKVSLNRKKIRRMGMVLLAVVSAIFVLKINSSMSEINSIYWGILKHLGRLFSGEASYRMRTIRALINYRLDHPNIILLLVGSGYGSSSIVLENFGISLSNMRYVVDNQIVSIFFEFGIIAGVFIVCLFIESIWSFIKSKDKENRLICALYICNFLVSFTYESFGYQVAAYLFFFILGAKLAKKYSLLE